MPRSRVAFAETHPGLLPGNGERLDERQAARGAQPTWSTRLGERRAPDQFHDERLRLAWTAAFEAVDRRDVRVVQGGEHLRLALEAGDALGIGRKGRRQNLDRDVTIELGIACAVDLAHAAGAQLIEAHAIRP